MRQKGFTLVEVLVGSAVFIVVAISAYGAFSSLFQLAGLNKAQMLAVGLADEQFEIIRNMPYSSVGLTTGIPQGVLPQTQTLSRGGFIFSVGLTIRGMNLSENTYQLSSKLVEVNISCASCQGHFTPVVLTGQVSPANLQSASVGGALVVQVLNSSGQPVSGATVNVQNVNNPQITDTDVTNNEGLLNIMGVATGTDAYRITVTKNGYSTDHTYPKNGTAGATPNNPDANVLDQQVTNTSFAIDSLGSLHVSSVSPVCTPVGNINFSISGSKTIANVPSTILKYPLATTSTNGSGIKDFSNMEWDAYNLIPTDTNYDVAGINPPTPITLNSGATENVQFVVVPKNGNSLMVTVTDSSGLPLSGATVTLTNGGYNQSNVTGEGYVSQTDWSGGDSQADFNISTPNRYFYGSNVDTATSSGNIFMSFAPFTGYDITSTSTLESSTFDLGTSSNLFGLFWKPTSQPALVGSDGVKFQFATNPTSTSTSWNYFGPDGTGNTYFTAPGTSINAISNGNEFARYRVYLKSDTATVTPSVSDVSFAYSSACTSPGQVLFQGLSVGAYNISINLSGYATYSGSVSVGTGWQDQTIPLVKQ